MVIIQQRNTGADRLQDVRLLRRPHLVLPHIQSGLLGDVLKDNGPGFYEAARGDGALFGVENRGKHAGGGGPSLLLRRRISGTAAIDRRLRRRSLLRECCAAEEE